ncbi:MAG: HEAT repeat domain-containing protein [Halobacteriaceae archaeon]
MSDGDAEDGGDADAGDGAADADEADAPALDPETFEQRLDDAEAALDAAGTEADLDDVSSTLDEIAADLEAADLPEPDEEDAEDPAATIDDRIQTLRDAVEAERGPYAEDVAAAVREQTDPLAETRWTETGARELRTAVLTFLAAVAEADDALVADVEPVAAEDAAVDDLPEEAAAGAGEFVTAVDSAAEAAAPADLVDPLATVAEAVEDADLDPDADAATVEALDAAATDLADAVDAAEEYADLTVREQLRVEGFYDAIGQKHKDFPPEWTALRQWEQRDDAEMVLLALEKLDSDFMERHCLESLERMGNPAALDAMLERAERRDKPAIRVIGATGEARDDVLETLHEFVDGDPALQRVTLRALGQIGSTESTQPVANQLAAEESSVRSAAATALGHIGDERAVAPLADVLGDDTESDAVRASAARALVQIGTERALEAAAEHADDVSYVVEAAATPAAEALEADAPTA